MKMCIFCKKAGGSKEHIVADWLIKRMKAEKELVTIATVDARGLLEHRTHTLNNYVTKEVCGFCNNGWMSKLEGWFQNNLGALVEPAWPKMAHELIRNAAKGNKTLAQWALKTATMMNSNSPLTSIADEEMFSELYKSNVVAGVIVELGYIEHASINQTMSRGFHVTNAGEPSQWLARHDGKAYVCSFQLNHLAVRVMRCMGAIPVYSSTNQRFPLRVYPDVHDPYTVDYRFHRFQEFTDNLTLTTHAGMEWESRQ